MTVRPIEDSDVPQGSYALAIKAICTRLEKAGLILIRIGPLRKQTGFRLRFISGEILNVFDNGSVTVQGKNPARVREILGLGRGRNGQSVGEKGGNPARRTE